ncbi:MAG: hypothetical protein JO092_05970, partial [Candidatus Eremiobacteraeota bacterium]|nr:hypothetical protein [Candidatus Eremiobacteraeota bacterium]
MGRTVRPSSRPSAQVTLLAACGVAFILELWCTFASPRFNGAIGWEVGAESQGVQTVTYVKPGLPADRAGLRIGDKIVWRYGSISENVARSRWIAGVPYPLDVVRNGKHLIITVTPVPEPTTPTFWLRAALDLWFIGFATIIALRGTDLQARLLSWIVLLFALSHLLENDNNGFVSPWPWINEFVWLVGLP